MNQAGFRSVRMSFHSLMNVSASRDEASAARVLPGGTIPLINALWVVHVRQHERGSVVIIPADAFENPADSVVLEHGEGLAHDAHVVIATAMSDELHFAEGLVCCGVPSVKLLGGAKPIDEKRCSSASFGVGEHVKRLQTGRVAEVRRIVVDA